MGFQNWDPVFKALLNKKWAQSPATRTLSRCEAEMFKMWNSDTGMGNQLRKAVASRVGHEPGLDEAVREMRALAEEFLRRTCAAGSTRIDTLPSAAQAIRESLAADPTRTIASNEALTELLGRRPGGSELLEAVGHDAVRNQLRRDGGFESFLGPRELSQFLGVCRTRELRAAATVLEHVDVLARVVVPAVLAATRPADEERARAAVVCELAEQGIFVGEHPLVLPQPRALGAAIRSYLERGEHPWPEHVESVVREAVIVLDPTSYVTRPGYTAAATRPMVDFVCAHLARATGAVLPSRWYKGTSTPRSSQRQENWQRLVKLFGTTPEHLSSLRSHPQLWEATSVPRALVPTPRPPRPQVHPDPRLRTLARIEDFLAGRVDILGHLPAVDQLSKEELAAIEEVVGQYSSYAARLHEVHGVPLARRSKNEAEMDAILLSAFASSIVEGSFDTEWRDEQCFGSQSRIDTYLQLRPYALGLHQHGVVEVFAEADGEGHFTQVPRFHPVKEYRARDAKKAEALWRRSITGTDLVMVAIHHRLLSGPASLRLTHEVLARALSAAHAEGHWWMFLVPEGVDECRQAPGDCATTTLDVGCDGLRAVVLADPAWSSTQLQLL